MSPDTALGQHLLAGLAQKWELASSPAARVAVAAEALATFGPSFARNNDGDKSPTAQIGQLVGRMLAAALTGIK